MNRRFRIEGIYDSKTLRFLQGTSINHFGFDFRPRSFNFIQAYRQLELVQEHFNTRHRYDLHFCGEKEYVIEKITADLDQQLMKVAGRNVWDHARLEFSDTRETAFYDQFNAPYILHYHENISWNDLARAKNIKGLVLQYPSLLELHEKNEFARFMAKFNRDVHSIMPQGGLELCLRLDWGANVFPSLFEFLDIDILSLPVNWKLESSYRNVDPDKIRNELKICEGLFQDDAPSRHT